MKELARSAPGSRSYRVYFVGGGTAVYSGWRDSTIDIDIAADDDAVFRDVQDAEHFIRSGMVEPERFLSLVQGIPERSFAKYPTLTRQAVLEAVEAFLARMAN